VVALQFFSNLALKTQKVGFSVGVYSVLDETLHIAFLQGVPKHFTPSFPAETTIGRPEIVDIQLVMVTRT
jgi:hypothetical protein